MATRNYTFTACQLHEKAAAFHSKKAAFSQTETSEKGHLSCLF
jgi:hypothetical protein